MALLYDLEKLSESGMDAMQCAQRDWSPYLVHFTKASAMDEPQGLLKNPRIAYGDMKRCLSYADKFSWEVVESILSDGSPYIKASKIGTKEDSDSCVCLSECNLPGLFNHSERYGRFGFVFSKAKVFALGGRPCVYVDDSVNNAIKGRRGEGDLERKLWGLANILRPHDKVQDFTHEREWRLFSDLPLRDNLHAVLCPYAYATEFEALLRGRYLRVPVVPIDMLYEWGA